MSYEDHSEDVASDFRDALSELTMNSRVEITTLTVIARENTEYAHGISEVLQEHIKKVAPQRKLPALYLLDSIVKNVGTPYTIYFGRGLYSTFMDAYASVDNGTRRKMDEMLKTWKEPVPGSVDPRPVFSPETTRPIENALIKARTSALQAQHEHMRNEQQLLGRGRPTSATPYRETPTPPNQGGRPGFPLQGPHGQQQQPPQAMPQQQAYPFHPPPHQTTQTTPQPPVHATAGGPFQPPAPQQQQQQFPITYPPAAAPNRTSVDALNGDVERLIQVTKTEFAEKPYDASVAGRLKALLDLQAILKSQSLEHDKLVLVRNQIDALAVNLPSHLKAQYNPTPTPPAAAYPPFQPPPAGAPAPGLSAAVLAALAAARATVAAGATPPAQAAALPPPQPPAQPAGGVSIESLLGKGALAALLAARQQQPPPLPPPQQPPQPPPQPQYKPTPTPQFPPQLPQLLQGLQGAAAAPNAGNPLALMEMLRKAGILQQQSPAPGAAFHPPALPAAAPPLNVPGLANIMASIRSPAFAAARDPLREIQNEIKFTSSSLKQFRPHLLPMMYDNLGPPCTQCGRRFRTDDAGRAAKTAHMDWHFKVHQRIVEAEKRGQHRSWYVDQADWIHSRETVDSDGIGHSPDANGSASRGQAGRGSGGNAGGGADGASGDAGGKLQWIPVPTGSANTNQTCPICQEKFEMKWLDEAQEWVWIDAVRVGSRVYHASCHAEATRSGNNQSHPAAAAMSAMMSGSRGGTGPTGLPIPTGPAADRNRHQQPVLGKRKANDDANFHGNGNHRGNQKNGARGGATTAGGRKKKRSGLSGGGGGGGGNPRRPPDLDRVDPDIGGGSGGGSGSGDGAGGGGGRFGRNGKHRGGGHNDNSNNEDEKVDLNALPY
ncbi:mRNA 3' end processing factor [Sporothrix curviconia]|uniref:mRNA 3' end processing factor n=1 Tax=Sporothrix curviconia TaxID=1260050 RepID=A0ABP0BX87_9PEZI